MSDVILEKANNGLFENEIEFQGIYAKHLRILKEEIGLFETAREGYIISVVIGCLHKNYIRKNSDRATELDKPLSIFASDMVSRKQDLRFLYRLIMLYDDEKLTNEEYMDRAFRNDSDVNKREGLKENMKVFNHYATIGIEYLYDKYYNYDTRDKICDSLNDFMNSFQYDKYKLPKFKPEYY